MIRTRKAGALVVMLLACGGLGNEHESSQDEVADVKEPAAQNTAPHLPAPEVVVNPKPDPAQEDVNTKPESPAQEPSAEPVQTEATASLTGTIQRVLPSGVVLSVDPGNRPAVGSQAIIYKKVEQEFAGMSITAWVDIGLVEVVQAQGAGFEVKILERHSEMVVNGETKDHFETGATIRLDW